MSLSLLKSISVKQELDESQIRSEDSFSSYSPKRVKVTFIQHPQQYLLPQVQIHQSVLSTPELSGIKADFQEPPCSDDNSTQDLSPSMMKNQLFRLDSLSGPSKPLAKLETIAQQQKQQQQTKLEDIPENQLDDFPRKKRKYTINPNRVYKNYEGKVFECTNSDCGFKTLNRTSYYNHIKHSHQKDVIYKCQECTYTSMNKRNLNQHISYCHVDTVLTCPTCGKQNLNKYSLKKHMKEVHCEKQFPCDLCDNGRLFKSKSSLNKHKLNVHSQGSFSCSLCSYSTKCKQYLNEHMRHRHNNNNNVNNNNSIQQLQMQGNSNVIDISNVQKCQQVMDKQVYIQSVNELKMY